MRYRWDKIWHCMVLYIHHQYCFLNIICYFIMVVLNSLLYNCLVFTHEQYFFLILFCTFTTVVLNHCFCNYNYKNLRTHSLQRTLAPFVFEEIYNLPGKFHCKLHALVQPRKVTIDNTEWVWVPVEKNKYCNQPDEQSCPTYKQLPLQATASFS